MAYFAGNTYECTLQTQKYALFTI